MPQMYEIGKWRELASGRKIDFRLELPRTALVCVDLQRKTCDRHSPRGFSQTIAKSQPELADAYFARVEQQVVPNVQRLQAFFRQRGARVVHFAVGPELRDAADVPFAFRQVQAGGLGVTITSSDPEYQICEQVAPVDGEPVIHKVTMGGFTGTGAEALFRNLGIDTLVLVGGHTHACVEATGRGAADLGFKVAVVEDAVVNYMPLMHDAAMINFAGFIGRVATTDEVLAELGGASAGRRPAAGAAQAFQGRTRPS